MSKPFQLHRADGPINSANTVYPHVCTNSGDGSLWHHKEGEGEDQAVQQQQCVLDTLLRQSCRCYGERRRGFAASSLQRDRPHSPCQPCAPWQPHRPAVHSPGALLPIGISYVRESQPLVCDSTWSCPLGCCYLLHRSLLNFHAETNISIDHVSSADRRKMRNRTDGFHPNKGLVDVSKLTDKDNRGLAFGWLQFTGSLGGMLGNAFAVLLAGTTVFGLAGWRASFYLISALSFVVAFLVFKYAVDPRFAEAAYHPIKEDGIKALNLALKDTLQQAQRVVKIPTFLVIVAQGIAGNFPWAAMSFAPMWLELIGFSHGVTALLVFIFIASNALGGLFGGHMGDVLARQLPNSGRTILAQFSSSIGIPLGSVLLLFLPYDSSASILYGTLMFIMGFLMSWNATATNNPIFAEIVPENSRTTIYALDGSFETVLSSFAPLVVGLLAEHVFGYVGPNSDGTTAAADTQNASALAKSLYVALVVPSTFCCLIYSILYWTYPKDRDAAQIEAGMTSQLEKVSELSLKAGYVSLKEEANTTTELDEDLFELM